MSETTWKIKMILFGFTLCLKKPKIIPKILRFAWDYRARGHFKNKVWKKYTIPRIAWDHLKWRMLTVYGEELTIPKECDMMNYLNWRDKMKKGN